MLSLVGLVATLATHQTRPLPHWPQLININAVVSLFSLIMRTGTSVVLAEGNSQRSVVAAPECTGPRCWQALANGDGNGIAERRHWVTSSTSI